MTMVIDLEKSVTSSKDREQGKIKNNKKMTDHVHSIEQLDLWVVDDDSRKKYHKRYKKKKKLQQ